jgi:uncharacterized protein
MQQWQAPWWALGSSALGGHVQTIGPALFSRLHAPSASVGVLPLPAPRRERWTTPDGDFVDVDWLVSPPAPTAPLLILFHGLEGSSASHYARAFAHWARQAGAGCVVPHFRGCSGQLNLAPRFYFAGDHEEVAWVLARMAEQHPAGPRLAVGVSLGGNMLLRWAQEQQSQASRWVSAVAAVSAPLDLAAAGHAIAKGVSRQVYTRMFLNSMRPKALAKLKDFPGLYDEAALRRARDLYDYDNVVTAPLHGFANTEDYWVKCSAGPRLKDIQGLPTLVLNARNDPFLPASALPDASMVSDWVTLWQPEQGGHVGFPSGSWPGHVADMPTAVGQWLLQQVPSM